MHGNNASRQSARMDARNRCSHNALFGYVEDLAGYRRPWRRGSKHYNSKSKTLRTNRTGR